MGSGEGFSLRRGQGGGADWAGWLTVLGDGARRDQARGNLGTEHPEEQERAGSAPVIRFALQDLGVTRLDPLDVRSHARRLGPPSGTVLQRGWNVRVSWADPDAHPLASLPAEAPHGDRESDLRPEFLLVAGV